MNSEIKDTTLESVKEHEGLMLKAYKCPANKDTVGFGRNFEDVDFSPDEEKAMIDYWHKFHNCLLYTSPSPRDRTRSRMPSSA